MDFLELAKKRKTTYEFSSNDISDEQLAEILEAARWAPSCTNSQPWHFIVIRNPKIIDSLMNAVNYGDFHSNPRILIAVILVEERCKGKNFACFRGKDSHSHDTFMSCGIAASYITLAATDLGIDSCILTPDQEPVQKILKTKSKDFVPLLVGLGYEKSGAYQKKRERLPLAKLVSYNTFGGKG